MNLAGFLDPVSKDRTVREKKVGIVEVNERDRVEVFCVKCGNIRDMTLG